MRSAALLALAATFLSACTSHEPESSSGPTEAAAPVPQRPWPQTFAQPAVLVAREITIEGPPGLLEHVALRHDPRVHDYVVRTVAEGLLQEVTPKPDVTPSEVMRGYLDQLEVAAELRLVVLQRPGDCELVVTATGDVFFQRPGEPETRVERLRLAESSAP